MEMKYRDRPGAKGILDRVPKARKRVAHRHGKWDQTQAIGAQQCFVQDLQLDQWLLHVTVKFKRPGPGLKHHLTMKLLNLYYLYSLTQFWSKYQ